MTYGSQWAWDNANPYDEMEDEEEKEEPDPEFFEDYED